MRVYTEQITVDDADVLSGTTLEQLEDPGVLDIWVLSSQADSLISITGPNNDPIVESAEIPNETRAPRPNDDTPYSLKVSGGERFRVNVDIVTAATVILLAIYRKAGVDF